MSRCAIEMLSADLIMSVLDVLPVLDLWLLKLAGSRYITEVVREYLSRMSRRMYCETISREDAERRGLKKGLRRTALEITIERNQDGLVKYYLKKYQ